VPVKAAGCRAGRPALKAWFSRHRTRLVPAGVTRKSEKRLVWEICGAGAGASGACAGAGLLDPNMHTGAGVGSLSFRGVWVLFRLLPRQAKVGQVRPRWTGGLFRHAI